jgi:hypothetical protein
MPAAPALAMHFLTPELLGLPEIYRQHSPGGVFRTVGVMVKKDT